MMGAKTGGLETGAMVGATEMGVGPTAGAIVTGTEGS